MIEAIIKYRLRRELMGKSYGSSAMLEFNAVEVVKQILGEEPRVIGFYTVAYDSEMLVLELETSKYYIDVYYTVKGGEYIVMWCTVKKREIISSSPHPS